MARRSGRPSGSDGDVRLALLRAAATCFTANGFAGTTTRQILDSAGVTAPALYHQFGSKAGLYVAVASQTYDEVFAAFTAAQRQHSEPARRVVAILDSVVRLHGEHPGVARFFAVIDQDMDRHDELRELHDYRCRLADFWDSVCGSTTDTGVQRGQALAVQAIVEGLLRVGTGSRDHAELAAAGAVLARLVLAGGLAGG